MLQASIKSQDNETARSYNDLALFQAAFCDSYQALQSAWECGLSRDADILTRSPALLARDDIRTISLDDRKHVSDDLLEQFFIGTNEFLVYQKRLLDMDPDLQPFSALVLREISRWQQKALAASLLLDSDFVEPRLVVTGHVQKKHPFAPWQFPWGYLLEANQAMQIFNVTLNEGHDEKAGYDSVLERLRIRGMEHFIWRFAEKFWSLIPDSIGKRRFYYIRDAELVRDIGVAFAKRGYRIGCLSFPDPTSGPAMRVDMHQQDCASQVKDRLMAIIKPGVIQRISSIVPKAAHDVLFQTLDDLVWRQVQNYFYMKRHLEEEAGKCFTSRPTYIVTNYPQGGAALALSHFCLANNANKNRKYGPIIFAGVQHGVTRELVKERQNACNFEDTLCPNALVFSPAAEDMMRQNPFRMKGATVKSVGLTGDFKRTNKSKGLRLFKIRKQKSYDLLYAQSLLRPGSTFNGSIYQNDFENYRFEKTLCRRSLCKNSP